MSTFDNWLASVDGVAVEMDTSYGAQCWDLWSHYAVNMIGVDYWRTGTQAGGGCGSHPGYTCGIWYGFDGSGLNQWFTPVGNPQRGDVAIWDWGSPVGPNSHVAIVVEDRGGSVLTMTQNPGAAHYGNLSKAGILGYLRPDNQSFFDGNPAPAPAPSPAPGVGTQVVIEPGMTLWGLAEAYYGNGSRYMEIFNASSFRSGNPSLIFPGEIAIIP